MDWISEGEKSLLLTDVDLLTQNFPSTGIYSSQGISATESNSSLKEVALNCATFIITLSVVLSHMLALATASSSPSKYTLPSSTFVMS